MEKVGAHQIAPRQRAIECQICDQALGSGGAGTGVVDTRFRAQQWLVAKLEGEFGLALVTPGAQIACHGNTRQVVDQQKRPLDGTGIQIFTFGLSRFDHAQRGRWRQAQRGAAFEYRATEDGLDDLDGDNAALNFLLWQIGAHNPAGLAIGLGHGGSGFAEFGQPNRAVEI